MIATKSNGALVGAVVQLATRATAMEANEIVRMLVDLTTANARADEQRREIAERLAHLEIQIQRLSEEKVSAIQKQNSEFERRLAKIEESGFASWSFKKIMQLAAIIAAVSGAVAAAVKVWLMIMARFH